MSDEIERLRGLVKSAEWVCGDGDYSYCPWCNNSSCEGHTADCEAFPGGPCVERDRKNHESWVEGERRAMAIQAQQAKSHAEWERTTTPEGIVEGGGRLNLCSCRTFSKSTHFVSPRGYCRYCGGWQPEVIARVLGRQALDAKIDDLERYKRDELRKMLAL
jgi:hypothetical protein